MQKQVYQWIKNNTTFVVLVLLMMFFTGLVQFDHIKFELIWSDLKIIFEADTS